MNRDNLVLTLQFLNGERQEVFMECKTDYNEDSVTTVGTFDFYDKIGDLITVEEQRAFRNK